MTVRVTQWDEEGRPDNKLSSLASSQPRTRHTSIQPSSSQALKTVHLLGGRRQSSRGVNPKRSWSVISAVTVDLSWRKSENLDLNYCVIEGNMTGLKINYQRTAQIGLKWAMIQILLENCLEVFTLSIVTDQVCYEADMNQFKHSLLIQKMNTMWKNRQSKEPETTRKTKKSFDIFKHSETKNTFRILLKTISEWNLVQ